MCHVAPVCLTQLMLLWQVPQGGWVITDALEVEGSGLRSRSIVSALLLDVRNPPSLCFLTLQRKSAGEEVVALLFFFF